MEQGPEPRIPDFQKRAGCSVHWSAMADPPAPPEPRESDATVILRRISAGDSGAARDLLPLVYEHLRGLAESYMRGAPAGQTLQPIALVHEAYLKLVRHAESGWESRAHFFAVAATAMRQLLQDRVRRRRALKRGGGAAARDLERVQPEAGRAAIDPAILDETLTRLEALNPRQAKIVEMRFFGGATNEDVAHVLGLSTRMVEKEWRRTRAWLAAQLADGPSDGTDVELPT